MPLEPLICRSRYGNAKKSYKNQRKFGESKNTRKFASVRLRKNLQRIRVRKENLRKVTDKKQLKNGNLYMENELNLTIYKKQILTVLYRTIKSKNYGSNKLDSNQKKQNEW